MKLLMTLLPILIIFPAVLQAQQKEPVGCTKGEVAGAVLQFKKDAENGTIKLYTLSGLQPLPLEDESVFTKKYATSFHDFGCVAPANLSYYRNYNLQVFEYLNSEFGTSWQKELPPGIIGWQHYKETN
ncbi:FEKKY domain-containing protein [Flavobacterium rhizosphaerae]|uniref:Uncharacterized protein n=1 Tax=Flavobacterium rhizosphaerae TaxID=3163298 RepID=A0ABW8YX15_9FLAO